MRDLIDWSSFHFASVIDLPADYEVYDFSRGYDPERARTSLYGVGKYNERRPGMYATELFSGKRDIHVGIDLAGPVGQPIKSFYDGEIYLSAYNSAPGDYGYTLIVKYVLNDVPLYALYGHLSAPSIEGKEPGQAVRAGEIIAWIGDRHENGGWNPHLHFQLSFAQPLRCDLPGVVSQKDLECALEIYPDPRLVLGPLY